VQALIPPPSKDDQQEEAPNLKPDEIQFDDKGKKGKRGQMQVSRAQTADMWMRNIQTTPAQLLRRKFELEAEAQRR